MKASRKTALLILILFLTAAFVYAQAAEPEESPPPPQAEPMTEPPHGPGPMFNEEYITNLLEKIKQDDPNEAQRLEKLRQEDPHQFRAEIRRITRQQMESRHFEQPEDQTGMHNLRNPDKGFRAREKTREQLGEMERELISWLEKNEPQTAKELAELKVKDPPAYTKRIAIEMKKHRQIIETEKTNPAFAAVLKQDLVLKQQRDQLLEKIRAATDEKEKQQLTEQLKQVVSERYAIEVQKKQLEYENLKKELEELQKQVSKSEAELEGLKNKKTEYIDTNMKDLLEKANQPAGN
jgi:hypothetical protein